MRPTRRSFLAAAGTAATGALAGCTGRLTAEGAAFAASGATLPERVQVETGYTHHRTDDSTVSQRFEWYGIGRTVDVTNVVAEYDRAVELDLLGRRIQAAVFAALATPKVRLLGREYNPVAGMSTAELAELVQERYDEFDVAGARENYAWTVAGSGTTVTRFDAEAQLLAVGRPVDVHLYVSGAVEVGGDFLVTLSVHPQAFGRRESTVRRLMGAVEPA
ncbi:DUF6517 family protein [Natronomonas marina]|jgi:hypothetical protein|uniref:DUF6517 family protein n=1 Tax=Natronomonas marina TaxID=2961939 RepID=UPI0020C9C68D|nr:DUF6517 family protein [Natronomonas marina]